MPLDFLASSSERVEYVNPINDDLTAITVYVLAKFDSTNTFKDLVSHWRHAATQNYSWIMACHSSAGSRWFWEVAYDDTNNKDSVVIADATLAVNTTDWFCIIGRWIPSVVEIDVINLSTGASANNTTSISHTTISDSTQPLIIGSQDDESNFMDGSLAWPTVWEVALSDADVAALQGGTNPWRMRNADIQFCAPLFNLEYLNDWGPTHAAASVFNTPTTSIIGPATLQPWWVQSPFEEEPVFRIDSEYPDRLVTPFAAIPSGLIPGRTP